MGRLETGPVVTGMVSATIGDRASVPFRSVRDSRLPGGVTKFLFGRLIDSYAREQTAGRPAGPVVGALLRAMALEHRYERGEYIAALTAAVEFVAEYLVQPQEHLLRWITEGRDEVAHATVERKIASLYDYRYLPLLLSAWLSRRSGTMVSKAQLRDVIGSIDHRVAEKHSATELCLLARPIFAFVRWGGSNEVPLTVLRAFYLEKKLESFWTTVERGVGDHVHTISQPSLLSAIQSSGHSVVQVPEPETSVSLSGEAVPEQSETAEPFTSAPVPEPLFQEAAKPVSGLPELSSLIPPERRDLFVNRVFGRDADYYEAVIASLNDILSWKEAALFLSQFYQTNELDPFADEVVEFTDIVHHRYSQGPHP